MIYKFYDDYGKKLIVRLRMWYADIRGHHGKRWDYEPGDWYMGRHKKINKRRKIKWKKLKQKNIW